MASPMPQKIYCLSRHLLHRWVQQATMSERWFQLQTHLSLLTFEQDIKPKTSSSDYRACILPVLWKSQNGYRLRLLLGCVATLHDIFNLFTHSPSLTCVQHVLSALLSFTTLDSLSSTVHCLHCLAFLAFKMMLLMLVCSVVQPGVDDDM